jgi:hypothetical protein
MTQEIQGITLDAPIPDASIPASKFVTPLNLEGRQVNFHVGSTPPSSPQNGDLWIYNGIAGIYWMFVYDNSEITYKWKFIGGSPAFASDDNNSGNSTSTSFVTKGPTLTLPRAGEYLVRWAGAALPGAAAAFTMFIGIKVGSTDSTDAQAIQILHAFAASDFFPYSKERSVTVAAGDVVQQEHRVSSGSMQIHLLQLGVIPRRVI